MQIELNPTLEARLDAAAERAAVSVPELVERVLSDYLDECTDDSVQWVATTRDQLSRVWPEENFAHWGPPRAS